MSDLWPNHIATFRKRAGKSQDWLAAALNPATTKGTISQYESGKRKPSQGRLQEIADVLGCTAGELIDGPRTAANDQSSVPDGTESVVQVPLLGEVPAGPVREAIRHSRGFVLMPESEAPKDSYALRVSGESMNVHAPNGCTIVVNPNDRDFFDGRRYVIRTDDGEATFKEYREGPARLVAVSTYDDYEDIRLGGEPIEVLGRVISVTTRL
ncbi:helix-turn-helix domain-containing protein [Sphingobium yanoikuyae]|uniref:helix-turn-helix domain-containing protein n=1 Tax=Sphingobium yanoikuyae TaxID=13690 RepID=UPI0026EC96FC|nr:LexA family transcriptional regulator [Sphingobium yanoikuyae]